MGKKKRSSSTGSLKSFILLLLILGGGAYFYQNQQNLPEAKELTKELSHIGEGTEGSGTTPAGKAAGRGGVTTLGQPHQQQTGNSRHADQTGRNQVAANGIYRFIQ